MFNRLPIHKKADSPLAINAISYNSVHAILKSGLDRAKPAAEPVSPAPAHTNIRGGTYYQ